MRLYQSFLARGIFSAAAILGACHAISACSSDTLPSTPGGETPDDKPDGSSTKPKPGDAGSDAYTPPPGCESVDCSDHGLCVQTGSGLGCSCDEGFSGDSCSTKTADYGRRVKIADDLADPDVLKLSEDRFVVSGTSGNATGLDLYESNDLITWTKTKTYNPSAKDPNADYCFVWAPELVKDGGKNWVYFSAYRGPEGNTTCPPPANQDVTTYRASAADDSLDFGAPEALFQNTTGARTFTGKSCPSQGCDHAIRIDSTLHGGRLFYVFFNGRNSIASVSMTDNNDIIVHNGASAYPSSDETVNEAPEIFERNGTTYLFFSAADFRSKYRMAYVMGSSVTDVTRSKPVHDLSTPVRRKNGTLLENHGHNSVTTRHGEAFNFFHVGLFDSGGTLVKRDTYRQRITWNADGTAMNLNAVQISWNSLGGGNSYSLDLVLRDGSVIGPCIAAGTIGQNTSTTFLGSCPDAGDRLVHRSEVAAFRMYASPGSDFKKVGEVPYDGWTDAIQMTLTAP